MFVYGCHSLYTVGKTHKFTHKNTKQELKVETKLKYMRREDEMMFAFGSKTRTENMYILCSLLLCLLDGFLLSYIFIICVIVVAYIR